MGKKKSQSKRSTDGSWGYEQHNARISRKVAKLNKEDDIAAAAATASSSSSAEQQQQQHGRRKLIKGFERSIHLSHDSHEKKQETRLKLHISKTRRELEKLRQRLSAWDEVEEQASLLKKIRQTEEEEAKRRLDDDEKTATTAKKKKKRRKKSGPEAWTLKGAARPAWEVYDFDTRYVDPHLKAHEEARAKAKRVINAFQCCKGMFGSDLEEKGENEEKEGDNDNNNNRKNKEVSELLAQTCRSFLSLSMQSALLNLEAKKFARARELFLEIIELEGISSLNPPTNARCRLMRMYMEANRPDSARRLWERLPSNYSSVWIRYSAVLLEFVSWKILREDGSSRESAEKMLAHAVRSNVFCAFYIAYHDTFDKVMEYTDDVEDTDDGSLEQAIEYCTSEQMGNWLGTEGAVDFVKNAIKTVLNGGGDEEGNIHHFNISDLQWEEKIAKIEMDCDDDAVIDEEEPEPDVLMFSGMFRVGMDMISDAGGLGE